MKNTQYSGDGYCEVCGGLLTQKGGKVICLCCDREQDSSIDCKSQSTMKTEKQNHFQIGQTVRLVDGVQTPAEVELVQHGRSFSLVRLPVSKRVIQVPTRYLQSK